MKLLAIDPGTTQSGYCALDGRCIETSGVMSNDMMLEAIKTWKPERLAIEMIASYGMAVGREVFETCVWIGRMIESYHAPDKVELVYRREVKLHLCNSVKAKDTNVWQALQDKIGPVGLKRTPGPLYGVKSHARAALAVALTALETKR